MKRTLRNRLLALLLAVIMMIAPLCGCSDEKGVTVTIRISGILGDGDCTEAYTDTLLEFSEKHPDIYLYDTSTSKKDAFKLNAAIEASYTKSDSPNIMYYYNNADMEQLSEVFVSLEDIRADYPDFLSDIGENVLDCARWSDGEVYCIPVMSEWYALAVNLELLEWAGAPLPVDWQSFLEAISKLSAAGIVPVANSAEDSAAIIEHIIRTAEGQSAIKKGLSGDKYTLQNEWKDALEIYAELCAENAFAPSAYTLTLSGYASPSDAYDSILGSHRDKSLSLDAMELFREGRAAMAVVTNEQYSELSRMDNTVILTLPDYEQPQTAVSQSDAAVSGGDVGVSVSRWEITSSGDVSSSDMPETERLVASCREGFYITRRAYDDPLMRELIVELITDFASAQNGKRFAEAGYIPANTSTASGKCGLRSLIKASENGVPYSQSYITDSYAARWNYVEECAVKLQYGILTAPLMAELLGEESMSSVDILERIREEDKQDIELSSTDAQ